MVSISNKHSFFKCLKIQLKYLIFKSETVENASSSPSNGVIGASLFRNNAPQKPKEVLLTFRIQNDTLNITQRNCVFWDVMRNAWQQDGCQLVSANTEETVCKCDHLTNFGVIMDINGILQENVSITKHYLY